MANNQLTATAGGSGTQAATGTPQSATSGGFAANQQSSGSVQPGTPRDALTSKQSGIPLQSTQLPTVNLGTATTASTAPAPPKPHHTSPLLFGFSILLFVIATVLFWSASRPVKNTTE